MQTVLITIHLIIVLFLIVVVLLQRSEGGGLGIGGGGGMMTARQAGDALTRTTTILAVAFFATSLGLGILSRYSDETGGVLDRAERIQVGPDGEAAAPGEGGVLDQLGGDDVLIATTEPVTPVPPANQTGVPLTD